MKNGTLGIISGEAINLSNSINPPFISCIRSSPPTISAPAFLASSIFSPENEKENFIASKLHYDIYCVMTDLYKFTTLFLANVTL